jgi:ferric-dicitrate binding protein FerR (iron transport regulator)
MGDTATRVSTKRMSENELKTLGERSRQAAAVYLALREGFSPRVLWLLFVWLLRSRHNLRELIHMRRQDVLLTGMAWESTYVSRRDAAKVTRNEANVTYVNFRQRRLRESDASRRHRVVGWKAAVAAAVIPVMVYVAVSTLSRETSSGLLGIEHPYTIATSVESLPRTETLADGTALTLQDDKTTLRVDFTSTARHVRLLEGRATVEVAQDRAKPGRPFVLQTYLGSVAPVSGALPRFAVAIDTAGMEVEVYAGEVEIARRGKGGSQAIRLRRGDPVYRVPMDGISTLATNDTDGLVVLAPSG